MILRAIANCISPGGRNGCLAILIFHRVLARPDPILNWDLDALQFERVLQWLRSGFNVLPLDQAVIRLREKSLPARAAAITFDDGYADNFDVALPILQKYGLPATFFVATGYLNGGRMWNDTIVETIRNCQKPRLDLSKIGLGTYELDSADAVRKAIMSLLSEIKFRDPKERSHAVNFVAEAAGGRLRTDLMLTYEQVRAMRRAGMSIGAHTVTHPILAMIDSDNVRREILESKQFLESLLQERVSLFAYPNGKPTRDYRATDVTTIRSMDFDAAVTTAWGVADLDSDPMQLPRFTPWDKTHILFSARMIKNMLENTRLRREQVAQ